MKLTFTRQGLKEYKAWETSSPDTVEKIDELIADIFENGFMNGKGKPEKLSFSNTYVKKLISRVYEKME